MCPIRKRRGFACAKRIFNETFRRFFVSKQSAPCSCQLEEKAAPSEAVSITIGDISENNRRYSENIRTFSENAYSFRVKCLLLFTQMLPSFPEKPGSSAEKLGYPLPPTSICPSFSSGASDTKKASVSQKKRLVSFVQLFSGWLTRVIPAIRSSGISSVYTSSTESEYNQVVGKV